MKMKMKSEQMKNGGKIRVVVADDTTLFREGVIVLLQQHEDLEVAGRVGDGQQVVKAVEESRPDILLFDIIMATLNGQGPQILSQIRKESPETNVLILTGQYDEALLLQAMQSGAKGYVLKSVSPAELAKAIRAVHTGEAWIGRCVMGRLVERLRNLEKNSDVCLPTELVSRREMEVAQLVAVGLSNKEIANRLFLSEKTVKSHLASMFRKLHIRQRLQLALYTREQGLFTNHLAEARKIG